MTTTKPFDEIVEELVRARRLLVTSPLVPSLELALRPLNRAVELLGGSQLELEEAERARLTHEVVTVGRLLDGLGRWLTSRGALTPTYNRSAEFALASDAAWGGGLPHRGQLLVEG